MKRSLRALILLVGLVGTFAYGRDPEGSNSLGTVVRVVLAIRTATIQSQGVRGCLTKMSNYSNHERNFRGWPKWPAFFFTWRLSCPGVSDSTFRACGGRFPIFRRFRIRSGRLRFGGRYRSCTAR